MRRLSSGDLSDEVAALIGRPLGEDESFAVAVSGGPDSLALLLLAHAAFGHQVQALTVDHGLRDASAGEAAMVAGVCAARAIPQETLVWRGEKPGANRQAAARAARYDLMRDWCAANGIAWLATAHHADDVAETLLMRLARGSGSGGLSGIRSRRDLGQGVTLLRPLLGRRRAELAAMVTSAGLSAADDPSNRDLHYDRTQARALLTGTPWLFAERLASSAANLRDAEAALDWTAALAWDSRVEVLPDWTAIDAAGLPTELARRLVQRALAVLGACAEGPQVTRMIAVLQAGGTSTLGAVQGRGGDRWTFRRVAERQNNRLR